jgi:hypothetical protein
MVLSVDTYHRIVEAGALVLPRFATVAVRVIVCRPPLSGRYGGIVRSTAGST